MKFDELPDILTAAILAKYLSLSKRRVYELMDIIPEAGGMPCVRIGRSKRVLKADLNEWLENRKDSKNFYPSTEDNDIEGDMREELSWIMQ